MRKSPVQPPETSWRFVQELQEPLWTRHFWKPRPARENEASLASGYCLLNNFPDENHLLETACCDLQDFLQAGPVPLNDVPDKSTFIIETAKVTTGIREEYHIAIDKNKAVIAAADTEGIRRGIFHLEEEMLRAGGPFLPLGKIMRTPVIRTRISRCFFGPINRPPANRDELTDDIDYYPDQYLNRLAHHGVNGLWLTIKFSDLCPSRFFPEHAQDSERRLEKLRRTVEKCARYGIKIYAFCTEPLAFGGAQECAAHHIELNSPKVLLQYPELAGHRGGSLSYFCASSEAGQEYLEDCTYHLFSQVPGLGGLIDINMGERPTHCYSWLDSFDANNCPRCSKRPIAEVFRDTLAALQRGIQRANQDAELISWLYVSRFHSPFGKIEDKRAAVYKKELENIAAAVPPKVLFQLNFESHGIVSQWGRDHLILDYSLAYVGPSEVFEHCARAAIKNGARVSAKLQVGNSHEVATAPFVPVPGSIYRKYQKMHELGVSAAMQCWFFGNYPSLMTAAAGRLSFAPLPADEEDFLLELAAPLWGEDAPIVAKAWQHFFDAYSRFPAALPFSRYGPVHDAIAWPLHLFPVDQPMQPSWQLKVQPDGDRVPELFAPEFSFDEVIATTRAMAEEWRKGVELLESLEDHYIEKTNKLHRHPEGVTTTEGSPEVFAEAVEISGDDVKKRNQQLKEIGVAKALGLQLQSAYNVLQFYALREELPFLNSENQQNRLREMENIVYAEIDNSSKLAELARRDSRLGFHSEAEGYKYFPEKLEWRIAQLQTLLAEDFPQVYQQIEKGKVLFPEYTGAEPQGAIYKAPFFTSPVNWEICTIEECAVSDSSNKLLASQFFCTWQAAADQQNFHLRIQCQSLAEDEYLLIEIEPRRLWPAQKFFLWPNGKVCFDGKKSWDDDRWKAQIDKTANSWKAELNIPWECLGKGITFKRPLRLNISRIINGRGAVRWQHHKPWPKRLTFLDDNPHDYGWVFSVE